jgi:hypothetical protein
MAAVQRLVQRCLLAAGPAAAAVMLRRGGRAAVLPLRQCQHLPAELEPDLLRASTQERQAVKVHQAPLIMVARAAMVAALRAQIVFGAAAAVVVAKEPRRLPKAVVHII